MEARKYKMIIWTCMLLFPPLAIIQWPLFVHWKSKPGEENKLKLEKSLTTGISIVFVELTVICFLFYHFGRGFIEVMGTFY
jgi:hypothetical protein